MVRTHSGGVFTDLEPKLSLNRWITSKYLESREWPRHKLQEVKHETNSLKRKARNEHEREFSQKNFNKPWGVVQTECPSGTSLSKSNFLLSAWQSKQRQTTKGLFHSKNFSIDTWCNVSPFWRSYTRTTVFSHKNRFQWADLLEPFSNSDSVRNLIWWTTWATEQKLYLISPHTGWFMWISSFMWTSL